MIREKIKVDDFNRISKDHEYFLWNFVIQGQGMSSTHIRPIFEPEDYKNPNPLKSILELIPIPYFESRLEESYDFVMNLGDIFTKNVYKQNFFYPLIIGFNKRRVVSSTYSRCYCVEGILEIIGDLNTQFILDANS
jgi:hypothetical protein